MRVSAIVAAFNEGPRVADVVRVLKRCSGVDDVVVVDDGSEDYTTAAALAAGARVITLPHNLGKGGAVAKGLEATDGEIILLIDADLIGLSSKHIGDLLKPVREGSADMTIGLFRGGRLSTYFSNWIAKPFTGQRAFKRSLVDPKELEKTRYGLETILTQISKEKGIIVTRICLDDITQVTKEEKMGFSKGSRLRMTMYSEVIRQFFRRFFMAR